jgi:hypothetical protein
MPVKQYEFEPEEHDPRIAAARQWEDMRDSLNVTRDALEHSEADRVALSVLVDMLRKELTAAKRDLSVAERSTLAMRAKLQSAGLIVLDALQADEAERMAVVPEVKNPARHPQNTEEDKPAADNIVKDSVTRISGTRPPTNRFG